MSDTKKMIRLPRSSVTLVGDDAWIEIDGRIEDFIVALLVELDRNKDAKEERRDRRCKKQSFPRRG